MQIDESKVQRIEFHQAFETDRPRNKPRAWLRVKTAPETQSHAVVRGHRIAPGEEKTIEVYVDEVPQYLAMARTEEHRQVMATAKRMAAKARERWISQRLGGAETSGDQARDRERLDLECPINWAQLEYLKAAADSLGVEVPKSGIPKLDLVEVVRTDVEAPDTPENLATKSATTQAQVIADAIARLMEMQDRKAAQAERRNDNRK